MKKILLTAFEPFGGLEINSSLMVLNNIKSILRNAEVVKLTLPVVYGESFDVLKSAMEESGPDAVVCMGQAGGRERICIERVALNINSGRIADNNGIRKTDELILQDGREAYLTNLPYIEMIRRAGENVVVSHSAGTYICNDVFYRLMDFITNSAPGPTGGFIHLPYTEHFGKMPYIDLKTQTGCVEAMLEVLGD